MLAMVSFIGAGMWRRDGRDESHGPQEPATLPERLAIIADAPPFELIDQDGKAVTSKSLAGKPWIADLVFTHCAGPCPLMTAKMAKLQKEISSPQGQNVQFVSFSVDPTRDTPAVLKEYAGRFKADESRWKFLTGAPETIFATARGLLVTALPAEGSNDIIHDERFILVDGQGKIRGYYSSRDEEAMERLKEDAAKLAE